MLNKKGFVALEIIIYGAFLSMLMFVMVAMLGYIYPTFELQREVHLLGKQAQQYGGLRYSDVDNFQESISNIDFVKNSKKEITIEAYTSPGGINVIGANDISYIKKGSGEVINIVVKIPSNNAISRFTDKSSEYYRFKTSVMSEKY